MSPLLSMVATPFNNTTVRRPLPAGSTLYTFTSHTFTNATAVGQNGPTLANCQSAYSATSWASNPSYFSVSNGIQLWTVPRTGSYTITAIGASGALSSGTFYPGRPGSGATIIGTFTLSANTILNIVVGQMGIYGADGSGGGGGSFVYTDTIGGSGLLIAAGGGGGSGHGSSTYTSGPWGGGGSSTTSPTNGLSVNGTPGSKGIGQGGSGGTTSSFGCGGGGAGWLSDGDRGQGTTLYRGYGGSRWTGGTGDGSTANTGHGGFGGGGGWGGNAGAPGGGGGYSGGGGGNGWNNVSWGSGGGGGSYNTGTNQTNTAGATGTTTVSHGSVLIQFIA